MVTTVSCQTNQTRLVSSIELKTPFISDAITLDVESNCLTTIQLESLSCDLSNSGIYYSARCYWKPVQGIPVDFFVLSRHHRNCQAPSSSSASPSPADAAYDPCYDYNEIVYLDYPSHEFPASVLEYYEVEVVGIPRDWAPLNPQEARCLLKVTTSFAVPNKYLVITVCVVLLVTVTIIVAALVLGPLRHKVVEKCRKTNTSQATQQPSVALTSTNGNSGAPGPSSGHQDGTARDAKDIELAIKPA